MLLNVKYFATQIVRHALPATVLSRRASFVLLLLQLTAKWVRIPSFFFSLAKRPHSFRGNWLNNHHITKYDFYFVQLADFRFLRFFLFFWPEQIVIKRCVCVFFVVFKLTRFVKTNIDVCCVGRRRLCKKKLLEGSKTNELNQNNIFLIVAYRKQFRPPINFGFLKTWWRVEAYCWCWFEIW